MDKSNNTHDDISAGALLSARRKRYLKECAVCGTKFEGTATAVTCSDRCRKRKSRNSKNT